VPCDRPLHHAAEIGTDIVTRIGTAIVTANRGVNGAGVETMAGIVRQRGGGMLLVHQ
jgi:hypothetical protein